MKEFLRKRLCDRVFLRTGFSTNVFVRMFFLRKQNDLISVGDAEGSQLLIYLSSDRLVIQTEGGLVKEFRLGDLSSI